MNIDTDKVLKILNQEKLHKLHLKYGCLCENCEHFQPDTPVMFLGKEHMFGRCVKFSIQRKDDDYCQDFKYDLGE